MPPTTATLERGSVVSPPLPAAPYVSVDRTHLMKVFRDAKRLIGTYSVSTPILVEAAADGVSARFVPPSSSGTVVEARSGLVAPSGGAQAVIRTNALNLAVDMLPLLRSDQLHVSVDRRSRNVAFLTMSDPAIPRHEFRLRAMSPADAHGFYSLPDEALGPIVMPSSGNLVAPAYDLSQALRIAAQPKQSYGFGQLPIQIQLTERGVRVVGGIHGRAIHVCHIPCVTSDDDPFPTVVVEAALAERVRKVFGRRESALLGYVPAVRYGPGRLLVDTGSVTISMPAGAVKDGSYSTRSSYDLDTATADSVDRTVTRLVEAPTKVTVDRKRLREALGRAAAGRARSLEPSVEVACGGGSVVLRACEPALRESLPIGGGPAEATVLGRYPTRRLVAAAAAMRRAEVVLGFGDGPDLAVGEPDGGRLCLISPIRR